MISRRGFNKSAPMATVAGTVALGSPMPANETYNVGQGSSIMDAAVEASDPLSKARRTFRDMIGKQVNPMQYRQMRKHWQSMNPNITALRSVSDQHKIHMMFEDHKRIEEERRSWLYSFAKMAGLPIDDWELRDKF